MRTIDQLACFGKRASKTQRYNVAAIEGHTAEYGKAVRGDIRRSDLRASSDRAKQYCLELLQRLVDIPSVFPKEEEVMLYLERDLLTLGLRPRRIAIEEGRFNLLCTQGSGSPHICLNAHSDTVPPNGRSLPRAITEGDRVYGLGSCDDKASIAAMVTAYLEIASRINEFEGTVDLLISVDEEGDAKGVKAAIARGYSCEMAVVGEPTGMDVVHTHCGLLFLKLTTTGISAHGCCPDNGISAVERMMSLVDELRAMINDYPAHDKIGAFSLNLGEIHAGDRPNRVPDECVARIDIRLAPPARVEQVLERARDIIDVKEWASFEIEKMGQPLDTAVDSVLVKAARESGARFGVGGNLTGWRGWTEAESFQTLLGADAIVMGPGDIRQAHSANEFVSISQTQLAAQMYVDLVEGICGGRK